MRELQGEQGSPGGGGLGDRIPDKAKVPGGRVLGDGGPMCVTSRRQGEGAPGRGSLGSWGSRGGLSVSLPLLLLCLLLLFLGLSPCSPGSPPAPRGAPGALLSRAAQGPVDREGASVAGLPQPPALRMLAGQVPCPRCPSGREGMLQPWPPLPKVMGG